jgi:hypothetical protein
MTIEPNHWSWILDDPDIEWVDSKEHYGAYQLVRRSTGEVVGSGQRCYPAEHFEQFIAPAASFRHQLPDPVDPEPIAQSQQPSPEASMDGRGNGRQAPGTDD